MWAQMLCPWKPWQHWWKNKIGKPCFGSQSPGNAHELEVCKRKGVGIDFSEPEGHAGPKSQVRGVAALVSMWGLPGSNGNSRSASSSAFGGREQCSQAWCFFRIPWTRGRQNGAGDSCMEPPGNLLRTGHKLHFWTRKPAHVRTRKLARFGTRIWQRFSTVFCFPGSLPVFLVSSFPGFLSLVFLVSFLFHPVYFSDVISWF